MDVTINNVCSIAIFLLILHHKYDIGINMGSVLQIENLTKSFGDRVLFSNITFGIMDGDKVGIIAKNGTGKTTLLRTIAGVEPYDSGRIVFRNDLRVGYLEQVPELDKNLSVLDVCLNGDDELSATLRRYETAITCGDSDDIANAILQMDSMSAWDYEDRFKQILSQLKITDVHQKIGQLSGGQIKRVALAKILINNPDFLMLDEPTNHLDIEMIEWLENYLSRSKISLLMVTHDRYFLDNVCTKIIEIDQSGIFEYEGNYNYYLEKRQERIDSQNAEVARAKNLLRRELEWMRRQPQARGSKAKYRIDAYYELEKKAASRREDKDVTLNVKSGYIGSKIFDAHSVSKRFGEKVILSDFNYVFARYEKLGIVGGNGVGKSTFIKLLLGETAPDSGYFDIGETVRFGYYSQQGITFDENKKVIDAVREIAEHITFDEKTSYSASQFLQLFLFSPADQQKLIAKLSGGEKRRLYLATVLMRKPNFLILDEPTNDLDIRTLEVLEDYLDNFKGCVIVISHDRFFMDRIVDHILVFEGDGKIKDFPGGYSDYRIWKAEKEKAEQKEAKGKAEQKEDWKAYKEQRRPVKMTYAERKELEAITKGLDELNAEKAELEYYFNSGENLNEMAEKSQRYSEVKDLIDEKELRWLELSEKESNG